MAQAQQLNFFLNLTGIHIRVLLKHFLHPGSGIVLVFPVEYTRINQFRAKRCESDAAVLRFQKIFPYQIEQSPVRGAVYLLDGL